MVKVDAAYGIHAAGPLAITGAGRLGVRGETAIGCEQAIDISGGNVLAVGGDSGEGITSDGSLAISGSTVTAMGGSGIRAAQLGVSGANSVVIAQANGSDGRAVTVEGNITLNDGLAVVSPTGGRIGSGSSGTTILNRDGSVAPQAMISMPVLYGVWVGQTQVTSANCDDVLGDDSVSYNPDSRTLYFTSTCPTVEGTHGSAMIQAESDLTVVALEDGLTLENAGAAEGLRAAGDLALWGNVTVNVRDRAIFAQGDLDVYGSLTARGQGNAQTTGGLIEAGGDVCIWDDLSGYNKTGYGLRAGGDVEIAGDVKLTVVTGSVINTKGNIEIEGSLDNTLFDGQARVSTNGLMADGDITVEGNVKLVTRSNGIRSKGGSINVVTGRWEVNNASNGEVAMDAAHIILPDTHGVIVPDGGQVKTYDADGQTREAVYNGNDVAKYATIYWQSEKPADEPAIPQVGIQPAGATLTYGGADGEDRTLTAVATVEPESLRGTLRYRWQRQEENGYWRSVASGVDTTEYVIPDNEPVGAYNYRCMVTNTLNGASKQAVSDPLIVTIEKAAPTIVMRPRPLTLIYSGRAQRLAIVGSVTGGTMLYSLDGRNWSGSVPAATDVGSYTLYYRVQGDENHSDLPAERLEASIARRQLVIAAEEKDKSVGAADPAFTFVASGLASGDRLEGALTREPGEAAGPYPITLGTLTGGGNYYIIYIGANLTILDDEKPEPAASPQPTQTPQTTDQPTATPTPSTTAQPTATPAPAQQPDTADFTLLATMKASGSTGMKLSWTKVSGADGYDVFFRRCTAGEYKLIASVDSGASRSFKVTGLKKGTAYKAYVRAWRDVDGARTYIGKASPTVHAIAGNANKKATNARRVTVKSPAVTLTVGGSAAIRAGVKGAKSGRRAFTHVKLLRYYSSNRNVATVSAAGKIKATGVGSCAIYVMANNGVRSTVRVTVLDGPTGIAFKKSGYSVGKGKRLKLAGEIRLKPSGASSACTWVSSDPGIATVSAKGVMKGMSKGTATITVTTANGKSARTTVNVK